MNAVRSSTATGTIATAKRGRFAPSPTGRLHLGSLLAAVGSYLDARHQAGEWLVRIENIDRAREVKGAADDILRTLEAFGLHWDGPVRYQHTRVEAYRAIIEQLQSRGQVYACDCERRDYAAQGAPGEVRYPGRCRLRKVPTASPHALRLCTQGCGSLTLTDRAQGEYTQDVEAEVGDFVLWRKDGFPAYQLAVVVDDEDQGITDVVRGMDLLDNTPRQRLLQSRLGFAAPTTLHLPLLLDERGDKLAKSRQSLPVEVHRRSAVLLAILTALRLPMPESLRHAPVEELLAYAVPQWDSARLRNLRTITLNIG